MKIRTSTETRYRSWVWNNGSVLVIRCSSKQPRRALNSFALAVRVMVEPGRRQLTTGQRPTPRDRPPVAYPSIRRHSRFSAKQLIEAAAAR